VQQLRQVCHWQWTAKILIMDLVDHHLSGLKSEALQRSVSLNPRWMVQEEALVVGEHFCRPVWNQISLHIFKVLQSSSW
jgi:hypothetical protein